MYVIYEPEDPADGDKCEWSFDLNRIKASRAEMIEKRFGENWDQWQVDVQSGNMKARRVLLWHLMSTDHPSLKYEDTPDFYAGEVTVEYSVAELQNINEKIQKASLPEDQKTQYAAAYDVAITEAMAREEARGETSEGKASSRKSAKPTPSP